MKLVLQVSQELKASRDPEAQQDHRALLEAEEILVCLVQMGSQGHKDQLVKRDQLVQRVILGLLGRLEIKEAQVSLDHLDLRDQEEMLDHLDLQDHRDSQAQLVQRELVEVLVNRDLLEI